MRYASKRIVPLIFIVIVCCLACEDDSSSRIIEVDPLAGLDLRNVVDGNTAKYALYQSSCDRGFHFTGDTLVVTVEESNDTVFLHEYYTPGSAFEASVRHLIIPKEGYLLIPQRGLSQFLFFYGNDTIFLDRKPEVELTQVGCKLFHDSKEFTGDFIGSLTKFHFGEIMITDKKGISCVPTVLDIDAYILYEDHLNMVHIIQQAEETSITGFMAIE